MRTLTGWLVHPRPPVELLPHVHVVDDAGRTIIRTTVTDPTGQRGWDHALAQLGYQRINSWRPRSGGHVCTVIRRLAGSADEFLLPSCTATTLLTGDEFAFLDAIPFGAHELVEEVECEYQAAHVGPHAGLGQTGEGSSWWLFWSNDERRLVEVEER